MIVDDIKHWSQRSSRFYRQNQGRSYTAEAERAAIGEPDFSALWPELEAVAPRDAWTARVAFDVGAVFFTARIGEHNVEVLHDGRGHLVTVVPSGVRARDYLHLPRGGGFGDANGNHDETVAETLGRALEASARVPVAEVTYAAH